MLGEEVALRPHRLCHKRGGVPSVSCGASKTAARKQKGRGADSRTGLLEAPAVIAREPTVEIQRRFGLEIMVLGAPTQLLPAGRPDGLVCHWLLRPRCGLG